MGGVEGPSTCLIEEAEQLSAQGGPVVPQQPLEDDGGGGTATEQAAAPASSNRLLPLPPSMPR